MSYVRGISGYFHLLFSGILQICKFMGDAVKQKYPDSYLISIGGFIFLR
jgi:hypothetical protein